MSKTIVITGAQQGIGKAIAEHFAKLNWNIVINDKNSKAKLERVKQNLIAKYNVKVLSCFGDVSQEEYVNLMFNEIISTFKKVDALVNNAGIVEDMDVKDRSVMLFNKTIINNAGSVFAMSKIFGAHMFKNKSGKIVNISSTNGDQTIYPTSIDYDASKAAINNLTKNFAIEFAPYVLVNAVMPGWVMTEMNKQLDKEFLENERKRILLNKFTKPQEIANVVEFLISEKSSALTGSIICADGGLSIKSV